MCGGASDRVPVFRTAGVPSSNVSMCSELGFATVAVVFYWFLASSYAPG